MKRNAYRNGLAVLLALCAALVSGWLTAIPNHRFGAGDFSLFAAVRVLPVVFLIHGILSGILLTHGLSKKVYLLFVPVTFSALWIGTSIEAGGAPADFVLSSAVGTVVYSVISLIGVLLCRGVTVMAGKFIRARSVREIGKNEQGKDIS